MRQITEKDLIAAIWGGAVLGGGGGADPKAGYELGKAALEEGQVLLASVDELDPQDTVVTASLVGSPKAGGMGPELSHYVEAFRLLEKVADIKAKAINTNECGGLATVNGWYQASRLGVPVVDAPCNGRAHPTGVMGSIGLHRDKSYVSRQAAVGRNARIYAEGDLEEASRMVRALSQSEGLVAVARNPVTAGYLKHNGAPGAISMCIDLGLAMADAIQRRLGFDPLVAECVGDVSKFDTEERLAGYCAANAAATFLKGVLLSFGTVGHVDIQVKGGFDIGEVSILSTNSQQAGQEVVRLTFMNEYLTCDVGTHTVFSFPDLISVVDVHTAWPVASANIREGMEVMVIGTSYENLILGQGMYDSELYKPLEEAIGRRFEAPKRQ